MKHKVFIYGLDYAGKTTIVETMKQEKTVSEANPTLSFNVSKYLVNNTQFQIWDAPGQISLRKTWNRGYERANLLIFVLDCATENRFGEAYQEFQKVLKKPITRGLPLVFLFHKMDLKAAVQNLECARKEFNLASIRNRKIVAYETSIYHLNSIKKFQSTLIDIAAGTMW